MIDTKRGGPGEVIPVQQGMASEPQIILISAFAPFELSAYQKSRIIGLGGTQLGLGALCIIVNVAAIIAWVNELTMVLVPGIWCGVLVSIEHLICEHYVSHTSPRMLSWWRHQMETFLA